MTTQQIQSATIEQLQAAINENRREQRLLIAKHIYELECDKVNDTYGIKPVFKSHSRNEGHSYKTLQQQRDEENNPSLYRAY